LHIGYRQTKKEKKEDPMNIILVMSDTFRYDNLACYGTPKAVTPRLDKFAEQAHVFHNAYLGSFPTIPNRLDIYSGRFSFIDHEWCALPHEVVTPQQILSASGYITKLIADNPHLLEAGFHYDRGFDGFDWIRGQELDPWRTSPKEVQVTGDPSKYRRVNLIMKRYLRNTSWWTCEEDRFVARSIHTACQWLEDNQDHDQFFLNIDHFDPHEPWDPPQRYIDIYDSDYVGEDIIYPRYDFVDEFLTPNEMARIRNLYLAETSLVDHWFGVLLDKVDELGLSEDTAIIFASDHGYLFGEHGITGKSLIPTVDGTRTLYESIRLYDELRRTPLLIRMPGQKKRHDIHALVQAPDLMPTLLEMAGLVSTETLAGEEHIQALQCGVLVTENWKFNPEELHGKSLMPLIRGDSEQLRDVAVCSNTIIHHTPMLAKAAIITQDGWCLHYAGGYDTWELGGKMYLSKIIDPEYARAPVQPALFYLPDDPHEENDVLEDNQALAREIFDRYLHWHEEVGTPAEHLAGRRRLR
jgi:arylsulfatase A-like enzyme